MPPIIDQNLCVMCNTCADVCSEDVYFGSEEGSFPLVAYPEECWHCNACVLDCPVEGAVTLRIPLPLMVVYNEDPPELPDNRSC